MQICLKCVECVVERSITEACIFRCDEITAEFADGFQNVGGSIIVAIGLPTVPNGANGAGRFPTTAASNCAMYGKRMRSSFIM